MTTSRVGGPKTSEFEIASDSSEKPPVLPLPCVPASETTDARFNKLQKAPSSDKLAKAFLSTQTANTAQLANFLNTRKPSGSVAVNDLAPREKVSNPTSVEVSVQRGGESTLKRSTLNTVEPEKLPVENANERAIKFNAMCEKLEAIFPSAEPTQATKTESATLNKKVISTLLAKSFEQELINNKNVGRPIDALSVRMQTLASLFVPAETEDQTTKQQSLIKGFFGEDIKFTYDSKNTGAYNPKNNSNAFYQYRNYGYDKSGDDGKIVGNKPEDRNFIDNSHPFYALSLIMNLHYVGHEVPIVGESNKGVKQNTSTIAKILTVPFTKHFLFKANYGAREQRANQSPRLPKEVFGTFTSPNEIEAADSVGLSTKEAPSEFFQKTGWESAKSSYKPKLGNAYNQNATEKDYYVAGASGATVGILCAHVRLASFDKYLQSDGQENKEKIDRHALKSELLDLSMSLYGWMGLAGDHSFYEVAFSHEFMDLYCSRFMNDEGKLHPASEEEVNGMINEIQKQNFMTSFLKKVNDAHPQSINTVLDKLSNLS